MPFNYCSLENVIIGNGGDLFPTLLGAVVTEFWWMQLSTSIVSEPYTWPASCIKNFLLPRMFGYVREHNACIWYVHDGSTNVKYTTIQNVFEKIISRPSQGALKISFFHFKLKFSQHRILMFVIRIEYSTNTLTLHL